MKKKPEAKKINYEGYFVKIDRFFAWVLLFSMLAFFVTGYGMTVGIVNRTFSTKLHLNVLPILVMGSFLIHSFFAVRLAFRRWRIWDSFGKYLLPMIYIFLLMGFVYVHFVYEGPSLNITEDSSIETEGGDDEVLTETGNQEETQEDSFREFTSSELAEYDGRDGSPAYVAVDGVVYDLSSVFEEGTHYSHLAGQELTSEFYSYHSLDEITKYPEVGKMQ